MPGAQGATGTQGAQGHQGEKGPPGPSGTLAGLSLSKDITAEQLVEALMPAHFFEEIFSLDPACAHNNLMPDPGITYITESKCLGTTEHSSSQVEGSFCWCRAIDPRMPDCFTPWAYQPVPHGIPVTSTIFFSNIEQCKLPDDGLATVRIGGPSGTNYNVLSTLTSATHTTPSKDSIARATGCAKLCRLLGPDARQRWESLPASQQQLINHHSWLNHAPWPPK
jgi:hypothetical protein